MALKDKMAGFLRSNSSIVVAVIGLLLIAISNSWLGLAMYAVVIHFMCAAYIIGLYDGNFLDIEQVRILVRQRKSNLEKRKGLTILFTLCTGSIIILVMRDQWYLFVVTLITIICVTIHVVDALQKIKRERGMIA